MNCCNTKRNSILINEIKSIENSKYFIDKWRRVCESGAEDIRRDILLILYKVVAIPEY